MIDNFDSFTFNLVYDLEALGCDVTVFRNDAPLTRVLEASRPGAVFVLSPGPGGPADAGICVDLVRAATGRYGLLGICLGHQVIVHAFGGEVDCADAPMHGRASEILCSPHPLFDGLEAPLVAGRYHSLTAVHVPKELETIATTAQGTVMAVAHWHHRIAGFQFHPESILTASGRSLLRAAIDWLGAGGGHERAA